MGAAQNKKPWRVRETAFPSAGSIEEQATFLLRYAILAPSTHNAQPWEFSIEDETVRVFADDSRWLEVADADRRELYFSIGCAVENLAVAAERFGFGTRIDLVPEERPDITATVELQPNGTGPDRSNLFDAITERRTNHNVYHDRPIREDLLGEFRRGVEEDGVELLLTSEDQREEIARLQTRADERQFDDPDYRKELGRYIGSGALGATWLTARIGQLAVTHLDLGDREAKKNSRLLRSSPEVAVITSADNDRSSQIEAGRAFERLFLLATNADIAVHPMNQILQIPDLKRDLSSLLGSGERTLQLLFRLGYAPAEGTRRPRRPLEATLRS